MTAADRWPDEATAAQEITDQMSADDLEDIWEDGADAWAEGIGQMRATEGLSVRRIVREIERIVDAMYED